MMQDIGRMDLDSFLNDDAIEVSDGTIDTSLFLALNHDTLLQKFSNLDVKSTHIYLNMNFLSASDFFEVIRKFCNILEELPYNHSAVMSCHIQAPLTLVYSELLAEEKNILIHFVEIFCQKVLCTEKSLNNVKLAHMGLSFMPARVLQTLLDSFLARANPLELDLSDNQLNEYDAEKLLEFIENYNKKIYNESNQIYFWSEAELSNLKTRSFSDLSRTKRCHLALVNILSNPHWARLVNPDQLYFFTALDLNDNEFVEVFEYLCKKIPFEIQRLKDRGVQASSVIQHISLVLDRAKNKSMISARLLLDCIALEPNILGSADFLKIIQYCEGSTEEKMALLEVIIQSPFQFSSHENNSANLRCSIENYSTRLGSGLDSETLKNALVKILDHMKYSNDFLKLRQFIAFSPLKALGDVLKQDIRLATLANNNLAFKEALKQPGQNSLAWLTEAFAVIPLNAQSIPDALINALKAEREAFKKTQKHTAVMVIQAQTSTGLHVETSMRYFIDQIIQTAPQAVLTAVKWCFPKDPASSAITSLCEKTIKPVQSSHAHDGCEARFEGPFNEIYTKPDFLKRLIFSDMILGDGAIFFDNNPLFSKLGVTIVPGQFYLKEHGYILKNLDFLKKLFSQDPKTLMFNQSQRIFLIAMASMVGYHDFSKALIKQVVESSPLPNKEQHLIFLTFAVAGFGDISSSSTAIQAIRAINPTQKITWVVASPERNILVKDMIPPGVDRIHVSDFHELRSNYSFLKLLIGCNTAIVSYPSFHYLKAHDLKFLFSFPGVKNVLNLTEYDFLYTDGSQLETQKTGVGSGSLGVFIRRPTFNSVPVFQNNYLNDKLQLGGDDLFFGYFAKVLTQEYESNFSSPSTFIAVAVQKAILKHLKNGRDGYPVINIVMPVFAEHLSGIEKDLEDFGFLAKISTLECHFKDQSQFHACNAEGVRVRLINPFPLSHSDMMRLLEKSDPLCLLTGDASLIEGIQASKVILYQIMYWKKGLYEALCAAIEPIALSYMHTRLSVDLKIYDNIVNGLNVGNDFYKMLALLDQKKLQWLKPLCLFLVVQGYSAITQKRKVEIIAPLVMHYEEALIQGITLIKNYLLAEKNLYANFPRYVYAKTTYPFDTMPYVFTPLRFQSQSLPLKRVLPLAPTVFPPNAPNREDMPIGADASVSAR